jgi:two-component system, NarL family, sensor histidine kinase DesK
LPDESWPGLEVFRVVEEDGELAVSKARPRGQRSMQESDDDAEPRPMKSPLLTRMLHLRARLVPEELQLGWMPILLLGYLAFLFLPAIFGSQGNEAAWDVPYGLVAPTLGSVLIFLPLYFYAFRLSGIRAILCMLAIAALAFVLLPINGFANTYLIYAIAITAFLNIPLPQRIGWMGVLLAAFLIETRLIGISLFVFALTAIISVAVFFSNHFQIENSRKRAALKLSHDEVRRLAALAERERIGRDLHDLLGHTLSLIALKSELAGKLLDRDIDGARREIDEVTRVARDALSQVRRAVTGIRAAGLAAELASARQLLESDGVSFTYVMDEVTLSVEQETGLALVLREAITNIQRHARAHRARVVLESTRNSLQLSIEDDGRGSAIVAGNGLNGMRERVESLGGELRIDSVRDKGTRIEITLAQTNSALAAAPIPAQHRIALD